MLLSLNIKNYAIIDSVSITFGDGLNVLTGETGAGKSILIGALSLALGYRANTDNIRSGENKASVQALFCVDKPSAFLGSLLENAGIEQEDGNLLITREIYQNGKNVCKINNTLVNVATLKQIGLILVDIHGQHEHQKLLNSNTHLSMLDAYGSKELNSHLAETKEAFINMRNALKEYKELNQRAQTQNEDAAFYASAIDELETAHLHIGEDKEISEKLNVLQNSEKIYELTNGAYSSLYSSEKNILNMLRQTVSELEKASAIDPKIKNIYDSISEAAIVIEDSVSELRDYKESIEFDPEKIDRLNERLNLIERLKRKYNDDISEISKLQELYKEKLSDISNIDAELSEAKSQFASSKKIYLENANKLSEKRKEVAGELSKKLCENLKDLAMGSTKFEVKFKTSEERHLTALGVDDVEFMISTNEGQELKPLAKIASGGEISRIMLALKSILADADETESLIFDEIDTGISGRTAQKVAQKMYSLSLKHQILCISHLPQIACLADTHFLIGKHSENGMTFTMIKNIDGKERESELARMLGGVEVNSTAHEHAAEMLRQANEYKANISAY